MQPIAQLPTSLGMMQRILFEQALELAIERNRRGELPGERSVLDRHVITTNE